MSEHEATAPDSALFTIAVVHEVTEDNFDGSPWPPDGGAFWSAVNRAAGFTRWRRVILKT